MRNNAGAFNMYGLLLEHQKLFLQAEKAFERLVLSRKKLHCSSSMLFNIFTKRINRFLLRSFLVVPVVVFCE